jgi:hypothetical protein
MFQANPRQFDLTRELEARSIGDVDWWNASQRHEWMRPGDVVLLWASGKESGVYAVGMLTSEAFEHEASESGTDAEANELKPWRVEFRYLAILRKPPAKHGLTALGEVRRIRRGGIRCRNPQPSCRSSVTGAAAVYAPMTPSRCSRSGRLLP